MQWFPARCTAMTTTFEAHVRRKVRRQVGKRALLSKHGRGASVSWVKLDDGFPDHPKVVGLSVPARWGFVAGLCYCAKYLTDGLIPERKARELAGRSVKELIDCGLWEQADKGYVVHDYLDYNPSRNEVTEHRQAVSEARSKAGSKGAASRWQTDGKDMAPSRPVPYPSPDPVLKPQKLTRFQRNGVGQ